MTFSLILAMMMSIRFTLTHASHASHTHHTRTARYVIVTCISEPQYGQYEFTIFSIIDGGTTKQHEASCVPIGASLLAHPYWCILIGAFLIGLARVDLLPCLEDDGMNMASAFSSSAVSSYIHAYRYNTDLNQVFAKYTYV